MCCTTTMGNVVDKALGATEENTHRHQTDIRNLLDKGESPMKYLV